MPGRGGVAAATIGGMAWAAALVPYAPGLAAAGLGWQGLTMGLFWATMPLAVLIWGLSAAQFLRDVPPAPLRPLLAIHLAPASLLSTVAALIGQPEMAMGFALMGGVLLVVLLVSARWVTVSGFTPIWGALTFPLAALAAALFGVGWDWPGVAVLIAALGVVPVVTWQVLRMWPDGRLAARTNAATA